MQEQEKMRIQKYLSQAGICSRRKAEEYISQGLIKVNGKIAQIGQSIIPGIDKVTLENKAIKQQQNLVYYKFNKPRGIVTTCAEYDQRNILDIVDIKERVFPIGRLDKETTGLILLTNDGRLANFLMHPRYNHQKEYMVETYDVVDDKQLKKLEDGLFILGSKTKKAKTKRLNPKKFLITITEGRNRQIRRMVEKIGHRVKKLKRVRIENINLGKLEIGEYKKLTKFEKDELFKRLGINEKIGEKS